MRTHRSRALFHVRKSNTGQPGTLPDSTVGGVPSRLGGIQNAQRRDREHNRNRTGVAVADAAGRSLKRSHGVSGDLRLVLAQSVRGPSIVALLSNSMVEHPRRQRHRRLELRGHSGVVLSRPLVRQRQFRGERPVRLARHQRRDIDQRRSLPGKARRIDDFGGGMARRQQVFDSNGGRRAGRSDAALLSDGFGVDGGRDGYRKRRSVDFLAQRRPDENRLRSRSRTPRPRKAR